MDDAEFATRLRRLEVGLRAVADEINAVADEMQRRREFEDEVDETIAAL